jgi:hypothetical protein
MKHQDTLLHTAFNYGSLRAMTEPDLLTNRSQFDLLSLNEQAHILIALVDAINEGGSIDVLVFADCVYCVQSDDDTSWELWQALGAFELYEQLRLQLQIIIWLLFASLSIKIVF